MLVLIIFSFIAGIVTVLSPCILPILPVILSSGIGGGRSKPTGVILGFIISFSFFTLFLSFIVNQTGISAANLRLISVFIILFFGISLIVPKIQNVFEILFSKLSYFAPRSDNKKGLVGGVLIGMSLGLLWTPCVGPILAAVISLAITNKVTATAAIITLAYSIGTAIPMFVIMVTGRNLFNKLPWLLANTGKIQKLFGVLMIMTGIAVLTNFDRKFQSFILDTFPQYGVSLTSIEENELVKNALEILE